MTVVEIDEPQPLGLKSHLADPLRPVVHNELEVSAKLRSLRLNPSPPLLRQLSKSAATPTRHSRIINSGDARLKMWPQKMLTLLCVQNFRSVSMIA